MSEPFVAQIAMAGFNFAPRGWAFCNGQILPITQNTALFSLLGTTYGGNGQSTFALPDLQSRAPMHSGQGPGLSPVNLGDIGGAESNTITIAAMPAHTHGAGAAPGSQPCGTGPGTSSAANGRFPGVVPRPLYADAPAGSLAPNPAATTGGGQPHNNLQPFLVVNFIIALQGIFPARN